MGRYILDTSALIDLERRREPAGSRIRSLIDAGEELGTCAIVIAEFCSGLSIDQIPLGTVVFESMTYWDMTLDTAIKASRYRFDFARRGIQLSTPDALIAAVAHEQSAVIVTLNVKDFPMTDVVIMPIPAAQR